MNAHVGTLGQPAPGSARPGNLYADLQSRTLWLGVDTAVDATGSVLISDMLSLMDDIANAESNANAYTDAAILTRAPLVHTHTASQITDFTGAVTTVVNGMPGLSFLHGMIMAYSGLITDIGVGSFAGWALCDGGNGTPDLRDKFIMGAGGGAVSGATNPLSAFSTDVQGGHVHTINNYQLKLADIPKHTHGFGTLGGIIVAGLTAAQGTHDHFITMTSNAQGGGPYRPLLQPAGNAVNVYTTVEPNHQHAGGTQAVDINSGATAPQTTGDGSHTHSMVTAGSHQHSIQTSQIRAVSPWVALAYIMKL